MSDTIATSRIEPILDPGRGPAVDTVPPVAPPPSPVSPPALATAEPAAAGSVAITDQLARLEDKTARIEEKLARAESSTQRVVDRFEASSHRMSEVAQQSDLMAVRGDVKYIARRVRNMPGFPALVFAAVITAVLAAVLMIAILRYMPGLLVR